MSLHRGQREYSLWLIFALFVIAGNLTGILYHPNKKPGRNKKKTTGNYRGKTRYYQ
jgi:hypothetical protein